MDLQVSITVGLNKSGAAQLRDLAALIESGAPRPVVAVQNSGTNEIQKGAAVSAPNGGAQRGLAAVLPEADDESEEKPKRRGRPTKAEQAAREAAEAEAEENSDDDLFGSPAEEQPAVLEKPTFDQLALKAKEYIKHFSADKLKSLLHTKFKGAKNLRDIHEGQYGNFYKLMHTEMTAN